MNSDSGHDMEVDGDTDGSYHKSVKKATAETVSFSLPEFVKQLFVEQWGNDAAYYHKLIVIVVHAIMLDFGFASFDTRSNSIVSAFHLRSELNSDLFKISLFYTLPQNDCGKCIRYIVLKFQILGDLMNIYGTLSENASGERRRIVTHSVQADEYELIPFLNVIWSNCWVNNGGLLIETPSRRAMLEFMRNVRDNLALPLLIDLREASSLIPPPCFMKLPNDIKLKILELLPCVDLATVSCASSELRDLGLMDYLWKLKFFEEFGDEENKDGRKGCWRRAFLERWNSKPPSGVSITKPKMCDDKVRHRRVPRMIVVNLFKASFVSRDLK
ncbi:hypothetical protein ABFX02_02G046700 [Erythranthe guttata]